MLNAYLSMGNKTVGMFVSNQGDWLDIFRRVEEAKSVIVPLMKPMTGLGVCIFDGLHSPAYAELTYISLDGKVNFSVSVDHSPRLPVEQTGDAAE